MQGTIMAIAPDGSYGQISAENGQLYSYWTSEVRNGEVQVGDAVQFSFETDQAVDITIFPRQAVVPGRAAPPPRMMPDPTAPSSFPPLAYWITLFTSPSGRISRRQFWLHGILPLFVLNIVLSLIPLINILAFFAGIWASVCICYKRFHDRGYAGSWSLLNLVPTVIATVLTIIAIFNGGSGIGAAGAIFTLAGVISIAQLFLVYARAGMPGDNQYGPDPKMGIYG